MQSIDQIIRFLSATSASTNALTILLGALASSLLLRFLVARLKPRVKSSAMYWDDALAYSIESPLQVLIWLVAICTALSLAYSGEENGFIRVINSFRDITVIASLAWFLVRFIKFSHANFVQAKATSGHIDRAAIDAFAEVLRLCVFVIAVLVAMQTLGFSIAGLLTFGGVGGIVVGFAAKDMLANFFGGFLIYLDRPFAVGDWVRSSDREIEGTVEDIGWRVTVIRKFDSRPLYVPNSIFSTIVVENPSRMTTRRIMETIGIRHQDAGIMAKIVSEVEAYLTAHPSIDQQQNIMVNFAKFAPSSLDFTVYCFCKTVDGPRFHQLKQEILLHILRVIKENGAECASPTSVVKLQGEVSTQ